MDREDIERALRRVGELLAAQQLIGEILLLGGAYMTLALRQREATKDVDAYFASNSESVRNAAAEAAGELGLPADWLNDAAKGFLYSQPEAELWLEVPGLRVFAPSPDYVFAMKAVAGRPQDLGDLHALRRILGLQTAEEALAIVTRYIPDRLLSPRVRYLVEGLFDES